LKKLEIFFCNSACNTFQRLIEFGALPTNPEIMVLDNQNNCHIFQVSREREEFVLSQAAYILFYAREGTPWCSSLIKPQEFCLDRSNSNTSPKSVLDNANSECISVADKDSLETSVIKDAVEATSTHIPCEREFEEIVSRGETEGISFQISCANMVDVSLPHGVSDGHNGVLHDEMLYFPPVEEDYSNQCAEKIGRKGDLRPSAPPRSPTPDIYSGELPGKGVYSIEVFAYFFPKSI
jgi:ubiquitin carboxyl-terminal hydrolase 36/42